MITRINAFNTKEDSLEPFIDTTNLMKSGGFING
jgi:hypothetical protein